MERKSAFPGLKKSLFLVLCVLLSLSGCLFSGGAGRAEAATVKNGLQKKGGSYYYYVKGKKVKNAWKTVKVTSGGKKVSYKYYFGSNGKAYQAKNLKSDYGCTKNIVVKKIGKYYYGFDNKGRMVKSGYYNNPIKYDSNGDTYTYYIDKNGRYNSKKTKAIRKAAKYGANAAALRKILGKPLKTFKLDSCSGEPGDEYQLNYKNIYVTIHRYPSGKETVYGIFSR